MNPNLFKILLELVMVSDPWPVEPERTYDIVTDILDDEAKRRGFGDWIEAYHRFEVNQSQEEVIAVLDLPFINSLVKQAEKRCSDDWPEDEVFNPDDVYGGNFDDGYYGGMDHGDTTSARMFLDKVGVSYTKPKQS